MTRFESAIVVDRSSVARQLLARYLRRYSKVTAEADSISDAQDRIAQGGISLVVLDASIDGALPWLEYHAAEASRPAFLIVTHRACPDEEARVTLLGTIGYLSKPISFGSLAHALTGAEEVFDPGPVRAHVLPMAEATIGDPTTGVAQVSCGVLDLSPEGALLSTPVPIAIGTGLVLCLILGKRAVKVRARVVRVQDPGWGVASGWGVLFEHHGNDARRAIEHFVEDCTALRAATRSR